MFFDFCIDIKLWLRTKPKIYKRDRSGKYKAIFFPDSPNPAL